MSYKNRRRNHWLASLIEPKPNNRLLEIGFGTGTVIKTLLNKEPNIRIWGVDHSEIMLKQATKMNKEAVKEDKVFLSQSSAENLNFPTLTFDIVYCGNVHLFWEDPLSVYKTIFSILKADGIFILVFQPQSILADKFIQNIANNIQSDLESACFKNFKILYNNELSRPSLGILARKKAEHDIIKYP